MIVFEDGIEALVNQIPLIDGFKPNFHWGDQSELTRYIALKPQPYPIVWLVSGSEEQDLKGRTEAHRNCKFILATRNLEESELNDVRLRGSFDTVLIPLAKRLVEGLTKFSITSIDDQKFTLTKFPHYAERVNTRSKEVNKTIDFWDAVTIDCSITMNTNCQNTIQWQTS